MDYHQANITTNLKMLVYKAQKRQFYGIIDIYVLYAPAFLSSL